MFQKISTKRFTIPFLAICLSALGSGRAAEASDCAAFLATAAPIKGKPFTTPGPSETVFTQKQAALSALPTGQSLRALVWNMYKGQKKNFWPTLQSLSAPQDFVLLQEAVFDPNALSRFCQTLSYRLVSAISFFQNNGFGTGVSTASKYAELSASFQRSRWREPVVNTAKIALITHYKIAGSHESLAVLNLHGINFVFDRGLQDQLEHLANELKSHSGPILVGGDFNTHSAGRRRAFELFAKSLELQHLILDDDKRRLRLDHVLVRGLEVTGARLRSDVKSSDHFPIEVEFQIPRGLSL